MENELRDALFQWKEELMEKKSAFMEIQDNTKMHTKDHDATLAALKDINDQYEKIKGYLSDIDWNADDPFKI